MVWNTIVSVLSNKKTLAIVAVVSGAIVAIAASYAVYQTRIEWKEQLESNRPYFTIKEPGIKQLSQSPPYRLQITMENIGIRPAYNLSGKIIIIEKNLKKEPQYIIDFSVANEIPHNTPTPYYNDGVLLPRNLPPQYIVFAIRYWDPIAKKSYSQVYFMKWEGIIDGRTHPDFVHVSEQEKQSIENLLKDLLKDFT